MLILLWTRVLYMIIPVVSTQTAIWGYSYVAEPHTECGHKQTVELVHQIFLNWIQCNAAENEPCEHSEE